MIMALPKGGMGEMRTWHSESINADMPNLPEKVRQLVFAEARPRRQQQVKEDAKAQRIHKETAEKNEDLIRALQAQLDTQATLLKQATKDATRYRKLVERARGKGRRA